MQVLRGFKYKLKLNESQRKTLNSWIGANRCLYNVALLQRTMNDYREYKIGYIEQARELPALKKEFPWMSDPPSQTLQQTLKNLDMAFTRFFKGESEFPKIKKKKDRIGIKFPTPSSIVILENKNPNKGLVNLPKIGVLKFYKSRELEGELRSCTISKAVDGFHISFLCKLNLQVPPNVLGEIGIDLGIVHTLSFSDPVEGTYFKDIPLEEIKRVEERIEYLQRELCKRTRYSKRWGKIKRKIAYLHHRIACIRHDFLWKSAVTLTKNHGLIVIEDLKTRNMTKSASRTLENPGKMVAQKSGLNRSILRQGWYTFSVMLGHKAQETGTVLVKVDPKYSSQECSSCGYKDENNRKSQANFSCNRCKMEMNADINAARNILARGRRVMAQKAVA